MADLSNTMHKPDVLSCLANLSNDEVFTPPEVANAMLDLLPQELFQSPDTTFLDPACKSGVFLREIAKRLLEGLESSIPDLQERTNHIFQKQLYGIAITELTAHLSRRSVYCSKTAKGNYSVVDFDTVDGNIRYKRIQHRWQNGKCAVCGASQQNYDRADNFETHAYEIIHTSKPEEIFNMKFDVIISNPPYQLSDGGNGLDQFRSTMLKDRHLRELVDYTNSIDCFPGVDIAGGVCYFLWDRDQEGTCRYTSNYNGDIVTTNRELNQYPTSIRYPIAEKIINRVKSHKTPVWYHVIRITTDEE